MKGLPQAPYRSYLCRYRRRTLLAALDTTKEYTEAAKRQFEDKDFALSVLKKMQDAFDAAIVAMEAYRETHAWAIEKTGHTRNDLTLLSETAEILARIKGLLADEARVVDRIPFTRFERILDRAISGTFMIM